MKIFHLLFAAIMTFTASLSFSNDLDVLTVTGNITKTNQPDKKTFIFSFNELSKLPNTIVHTKTIWTSTSDFSGPLISEILSAVGAHENAKTVEVKTIDNFYVTIPISDFKQWEVILAYSRDGRRLKASTKGPLWIIYPVDKYKSELNNNLTRPKLAWGVKEFVVK